MKEYLIGKPKLYDEELFLEFVQEILKTSCWGNNGPFVKEIEKFFEPLHAAVFANATLALEFAVEHHLSRFRAYGDYIAVPSFTFASTVTAIKRMGFIPEFIDSDDEYCMSLIDLERALIENSQIIGILPAHLFGNMCNTKEIERLAGNLPVLYDAAHCTGMYGLGDPHVISFHPTKLGGGFELGVLVSKNVDLIEKAKEWRNFGYDLTSYRDADLTQIGTNAKANEISAAAVLSQLRYLKDILYHYQAIHSIYKECLSKDFKVQEPNTLRTNYSYVTVRTNRDTYKILKTLAQKGIYGKKYFRPIHDMTVIRHNPLTHQCKNALKLYEQTFSLPTGLHVTLNDVRYICRQLNQL